MDDCGIAQNVTIANSLQLLAGALIGDPSRPGA